MITLHNIDPHSTVNAPYLFRELDSNGRLVVRDLYRDLSCPNCGKLNEEEVLRKGLPSGVQVKSKRPYIFSAEFVHMVDGRAKGILGELFADNVQFFEIPSSGFWVAMATKSIIPLEGDPGYRFLKKCHRCGRYRELLWDRSIPNPVLRHSNGFVSVRLEGTNGVIDRWYVSREYADRLESISPPLTGLVITSKEFNDTA